MGGRWRDKKKDHMTLACTLHGPLDLRLDSYDPPPLGGHDVLVGLGAGGICGSDLHYFQHGRAGVFALRQPLVPGHEASGVVQAVGPLVTRVRPGQRVAVNPAHACGRCDYCLSGRSNLCAHMLFLGSASVFPHVQGMFREAFVLGEAQLTPVDDEHISLGELACAEPLSVGLHAVRRAGEVMGRTVLITGAGTIGCMCVMAARLAGAGEIIVCDLNDRALEKAGAVGADRGVRSDQIGPREMANSCDVAIEAAGSPDALATCLMATRRGGRIVQVGTLPTELPFPALSIMVRELEYVGAFRAEREFDWAVAAIRTRRADVRPLITAQLPLSRAREAFELALDRTRSTKVQLVAG